MIKTYSKYLLVTALICMCSIFSAHCEGTNGIISYSVGSADFVVIDTNSKKILLYTVTRSGICLKQVRSMETALSFDETKVYSNGLTKAEEEKLQTMILNKDKKTK